MHPSIKPWITAAWRAIKKWRDHLWSLPAFAFTFYPAYKDALGTSLNMTLPDIPGWILITFPFLFVLAIAFWRRLVVLEEKLTPKLKLEFDPAKNGFVSHNLIGGPGIPLQDTIYVRVLPIVLSETPLRNCTCMLTGVFKLEEGKWAETKYFGNSLLTWTHTNGSADPIQLHKYKGDQFFDVLVIWLNTFDIKWAFPNFAVPYIFMDVLNEKDTFRIDVSVVSTDDNVAATLSLKFHIGKDYSHPRVSKFLGGY